MKFGASVNKKIKVVKQNRGGKKFVTSIFGLEEWGCDLTETAQRMAKKFGTGAAACEIDYKEDRNRMGILVQGDCTDRFEEFVETELAKCNIDME